MKIALFNIWDIRYHINCFEISDLKLKQFFFKESQMASADIHILLQKNLLSSD